MTAPARCTACRGLLVEDPKRPEGERIFCYDCRRPFCRLCERNHDGANDPSQHGDPDQPAAALGP